MNTGPVRIGGKIHRVYSSYGIIIGDDGRHYFFLPSYLKDPLQFVAIAPDQPVSFAPRQHPRGMRARNISVTFSKAVAHGN